MALSCFLLKQNSCFDALCHILLIQFLLYMPTNYSTNGYVPKAVAVTPLEAVHRQSTSQIKSITKSAIVRYMGKYFQEDGEFSHLTKNVFPSMLKFVTDVNFTSTAETEADNKVKFPIFKYHSEFASHMPCIVVSDGGLTAKSPGLGFDQGVFRGDDRVCYRIIHVVRSMNLSLGVFTGDQNSTEAIVDVLALMFGEMSGFTVGMALTDEEGIGNWIVRFPKVPEIGTVEHNTQGDDPKDQFWQSMTSLMLEYEDSFLVPFEEPRAAIFNVGQGEFPTRRLEFPSTVHVNRQQTGFARRLKPSEILTSSDPSTLMIKPGPMPGQYYLIGRKPGKAVLRVLDGTQGDSPGGLVRPTVLEEADVQVSY